jgi:hypothetical protein
MGVLLAWLYGVTSGLAAPQAAVTREQIAAEQAYDDAKARFATNSDNDEAVWQFAGACFDRADGEVKDSERAALAKEGIAACELLVRRRPKLAAGYYYLGMNQGQLARTKTLGALPLVKEMENSWKTALALDEHFDFAGPDRNLGQLYGDAPRPPLSIGHRAGAEAHAKRAVALEPGYPENHLNLIELYLKWNLTAAAESENEKLRALLPTARQRFSGPAWKSSWEDWNRRQEAIEKKLRQGRNAPARQRGP